MRILHVVPIVSENAAYGGPTRGTLRQAHELVRRGHEVTVLALSPDVREMTSEVEDALTVIRFPLVRLPGHRFAGAFSARALRWLRESGARFDLVHLHSGRELFPLLAMRILRSQRMPYVLQTHGMLSPRTSPVHRVYDALLTRPAVRHAYAVLSLTPFETRELETFVPADRIQRLVNGVEPILNESIAVDTPALRVIFVSRLHERKRPADLLAAVTRVRGTGVDVSVDFFGPDEGALTMLMEQIERTNAREYARYGGTLAYGDVRGVFTAYNVFVLPSVNEPFPNALLEAMASGLAVVCTDSCGLAPYIRDAGAGIVTVPGPEGIASALEQLVPYPGVRAGLGESALRLVREKFSMRAVGTSLQTIYEQAV